jgi:hypothetical protein
MIRDQPTVLTEQWPVILDSGYRIRDVEKLIGGGRLVTGQYPWEKEDQPRLPEVDHRDIPHSRQGHPTIE